MREEIRGNINLRPNEKKMLDQAIVQLGISKIVLVQLLIKWYCKHYREINLFDLDCDCDE